MRSAKPRGAVYYRGTDPGSAARIRTGDRSFDRLLFTTSTRAGARLYGKRIDRIELSPKARVLKEGTRAFRSMAKGLRNASLLTFASTVAARAKKAGYHAVHFNRQTDIGTAILNRRVIRSRRPVFGPLSAFKSSAMAGSGGYGN